MVAQDMVQADFLTLVMEQWGVGVLKVQEEVCLGPPAQWGPLEEWGILEWLESKENWMWTDWVSIEELPKQENVS